MESHGELPFLGKGMSGKALQLEYWSLGWVYDKAFGIYTLLLHVALLLHVHCYC